MLLSLGLGTGVEDAGARRWQFRYEKGADNGRPSEVEREKRLNRLSDLVELEECFFVFSQLGSKFDRRAP
jgi:hypothetical protein